MEITSISVLHICGLYFRAQRLIELYILTYIFFIHCIATSAAEYTAPEDCEWIPASGSDVSLSCHLQTIVGSGVLATNFSLIQSEHTTSLTIVCDSLFFESTL
ncbi:hypothetical protein X975_09820, partial [Stegodyphus mimosarum]